VWLFFYEISKKAFFKSDVNLNPTKTPTNQTNIFFFSLYKISTWLYSKSSLTAIFMINRIRKGCNIWTNFSSFRPKFAPRDIATFTINIIKMLQLFITARKVINLSRLFDFFPFDIFLPIVFGRLTFKCTGIVFFSRRMI